MADYKIKTLSWMASLALVGTVGLAACGDEDASESTRTASPAALASGSDVHLANLASDIERRTAVAGSDVHLANQAAEVASVARGRQADSARLTQQAEAYRNAETGNTSGSDVHLNNQAAEAYERQAKLDHAEKTFTSIDEPDPTDDEFVPGTRRMPMR